MAQLNLDRGTRDTLLFLVGLAGAIYEAVAEQVDRPYLLALFGGMMGLPWFIRKDERNDGKPGDDEDSPSSKGKGKAR